MRNDFEQKVEGRAGNRAEGTDNQQCKEFKILSTQVGVPNVRAEVANEAREEELSEVEKVERRG